MKSSELVEKIWEGWSAPGTLADADTAKTAFLLNLRQHLGYPFPKGFQKLSRMEDKLLVLLERFKVEEQDIPDEKIKEAHLAMIFPWSRAIISGCLFGKGQVTTLGVPADYGV